MATASLSSSSTGIRFVDTQLTSEKNGIRVGAITAVVLMVYTAIAATAGFLNNLEAGALDILILLSGVVYSIYRLKQAKGRHMGYLEGFGTGIITALVASVLLGIFFFAMGEVMPGAMEDLRARSLFGVDWSLMLALLSIILMGTMAGVITSLVAMQYFKSGEEKADMSGD